RAARLGRRALQVKDRAIGFTRPNASGGDGGHHSPPAHREKEERGTSMLALKYLLMLVGAGLFGSAGALVAYDIFLSEQLRRLLAWGKRDESGAEVEALARRPFRPVRWRRALELIAAAAVVMLLTESFVVIPDGA